MRPLSPFNAPFKSKMLVYRQSRCEGHPLNGGSICCQDFVCVLYQWATGCKAYQADAIFIHNLLFPYGRPNQGVARDNLPWVETTQKNVSNTAVRRPKQSSDRTGHAKRRQGQVSGKANTGRLSPC